ncbi:unnamed protein product, partial [Heterosigma akashiwo]
MPMHQNTRRHVLRLSCGFVLLCLLQLWICEGFKHRSIAKIATTTAPNNIVATRQVSGGEQINKFSEYFREEGKKIISSTILAGAIVGQLLAASRRPPSPDGGAAAGRRRLAHREPRLRGPHVQRERLASGAAEHAEAGPLEEQGRGLRLGAGHAGPAGRPVHAVPH